YAPRITQVETAEKALKMLKEKNYDMVITTLQLEDADAVEFCAGIKKNYPHTSTVLITHAPSKLSNISKEKLDKSFDGIFSWNGDTKIFLAIIKLIEDKLNVKPDTKIANVRVILVVEDSIKNYSSFLPALYYEVMAQTRALMSESLNKNQKIFRMRTRPKILLATSYEEAVKIIIDYKEYLIGIISDVRFPKNGKQEPEAGFELLKKSKNIIPDLPIILHSSEPEHRGRANSEGADFLDKNSPTMIQELREFFKANLGFGDFIFRMPNGDIVTRAQDMKELEKKLRTVPEESLKYHVQRNHFSIWLMARGEFILASELRHRTLEDYKDIEELRQDIIKSLSISRYRARQGIIADFTPERFDPQCRFTRIGSGSLGGKARGIAFISVLLAQKHTNQLKEKYSGVDIKVPITFVIGTEEFDKFMKINNLSRAAFEETDDRIIAEKFLEAGVSKELHDNLYTMLKYINYPLAVRSSSLLEDSHAQPFAGIYSTYMIPNNHPDLEIRLKQLLDGIKLVYASVYYQASKAYLDATANRIEEEKMGIIIQQIAGRTYDDLYYPDFSGVARTINFFPVSNMKREEGVAYVALGLGKAIMEGQNVLQFSPKHHDVLPQFFTTDYSIKNSQRDFYAIDLSASDKSLNWNESSTLRKENLARAEKDGTLDLLGSTYDIDNDMIHDGIHYNGLKFVSFAHILKSNIFPLANLLTDILELGKTGLGSAVEIEFAVDLAKKKGERHKFYFLQIRPMISDKEQSNIEIADIPQKKILCNSTHVLGNGIIRDVKDIIYVRPNDFNAANTPKIAEEIGKLNQTIKANGLFIGIGRWGTSDSWLGIPVNWSQISKARVMIEVALENFNIDPSHGSHFFHNITSLEIGYLTIPVNSYGDFVDWEWLEDQPAVYESPLVRHIKLETPLEVILNGRKGKGTILKPTIADL
ncbi:MAG: hypothetical protein NTY22_08605, partial [Proteobacteria bacterium]|nr:hypothetical protein [Pseudomonadota bacterium]